MRIARIVEALDALAPTATAESWDNVGLLVGDPARSTQAAIVSVDLTADALAAARKARAGLIVTHHPCVFAGGSAGASRGLLRVTPPAGAARTARTHASGSDLVYAAARQGVAVYASHTNFDRCALEVPTAVARGLGFTAQGRLTDLATDELRKLAFYVPPTAAERVLAAVFAAGAGRLGRYDECSFGIAGDGTFRPLAGARPAIGRPGRREQLDERRLEVLVPRGLQGQVLAALKRAHPYEEVAYDLWALEGRLSLYGLAHGLGYGVWGEFTRPKSFAQVARSVRRVFGVQGYWISDLMGDRSMLKRVGFVAGKGSSFIPAAAQLGLDVLITGEVGYHAQLEAARQGLAVMEIGHRESERLYLSTMRGWLTKLGLRARALDRPTQRLRFVS